MTSLRGTLVALGAAVGVAGLAALTVIGCSGGESSPPADGGGDEVAEGGGTADQSADSSGDVTIDSGGGDTGMQPDQGVDSPGPGLDGGVDARPDGGDSGIVLDAGDSGLGSVEIAYANALVAAYCQNQLSCCAGGADAGTAAYNVAQCESDNAGIGWETNLPQAYGSFTNGHVNIDMTKASQCIAAVQSLPCGHQTAAQWGAVTTACTGVLTGTQPTGSVGCLTSFECAPGNYCSPTGSDAGTGLCVALATQGQPCNTALNSLDQTIPDYMCSYLGTDDTGLFCNLVDPDSGVFSTCQPLLTTNGATCVSFGSSPQGNESYFDDQACGNASGGPLCGDNGCGTAASYPYAGVCTKYLLDGGTD